MEGVLEESGSGRKSKPRLKSLAELQRLLVETGGHLALYVYPSLKFGAFYHIPDDDSRFGEGGECGKHPWVVITPYEPQRPMIIACPRTSQSSLARGVGEFSMPGGILEELERDGVVILRIQRSFPANDFGNYAYIGLLPEIWQDRFRTALQQWAQKIARESEAP